MKARLLRSLIAERVSSGPCPGTTWTVGQCPQCREPVWLANAWAELLAGDPLAVAWCFECAHTLVDEPG